MAWAAALEHDMGVDNAGMNGMGAAALGCAIRRHGKIWRRTGTESHSGAAVARAADTLAKTVFGREPVPTGVFASDQYKPSVRYEEPEQTGDGPPALGSGANQLVAPSDLEVMKLNVDPAIEPDPLADYRMPYLNYLLCEALSTDKTEARRLARCAKSFVIIEGGLYRLSHNGIL
ncbi:uncharacterized protein [Miscanthus floridulus]|uniref:uncharacterized protein n=1 Tax=Miscanthus floridulus TaxID=154761 RepID=UPI00345A148F